MTEQTQQPTHAIAPESISEEQIEFKVTPTMIESLRGTKPWTQLLAILGFVGVLFMVVSGFLSIAGSSQMSQRGPAGLFPFFFIALINILMGLLYVFPSYLLLRYATSIGRLLDGGMQHSMEQALAYQKSFWKFVGIVGLITMAIAILGIAAAIIVPMLFHFVH